MKKENKGTMSNKEYLIKKSLVEFQNLIADYKINRKCGNISVHINLFKGGITSYKIAQEETGR